MLKSTHKKIEIHSENYLFFSRWVLAPVFLLCPITIIAIGVKYVQELFHLLSILLFCDLDEVLISALQMMDMILIMGLVVIVMLAGYETFVSKLDVEDHPDNPNWMKHVTFSKMKIWLIATIVAMSCIHLLIDYFKINSVSTTELIETIAIHITFVITAIGMAFMDKLLHSCEKDEE